MIAVRLLWLAVLLVVVPAWVGNCFLNVDKPCRNPVFLWISGQMLLWAGFQVICVPVILLEGRMWMDCSLLRLHPGAAGSGNGPVFPAVSYSAGSPGSKAGESRDYFVGAGWCAFAGAAGIGSADGLR